MSSQSPFSCNQMGSAFLAINSSTGRPSINWRSRNSLLFAVDEDRHEVLLSLAPRSFFGGGQFAFRTGLFAFFLEFDIVSTVRGRYSSQYCGGDLPTRLMTRG